MNIHLCCCVPEKERREELASLQGNVLLGDASQWQCRVELAAAIYEPVKERQQAWRDSSSLLLYKQAR